MEIKAEFFDMFTQIGISVEDNESRLVFRLDLPSEITQKLWLLTHGHGPEDE